MKLSRLLPIFAAVLLPACGTTFAVGYNGVSLSVKVDRPAPAPVPEPQPIEATK